MRVFDPGLKDRTGRSAPASFAARPQLNRADVVIHPRHGGDGIAWDK
jgi:hypothetical protein